METDSTDLVALLRSRRKARSEAAAILCDVEEQVVGFSFSLRHVRCTVSIAAHLSARNALLSSLDSVWADYLLACSHVC